MNKLVRLVDFQVYARPGGLPAEELRPINEALFAIYEPLRLWLKERDLKAPFRKIVIALSANGSSAAARTQVMNAGGVCQVVEAVGSAGLLQHVRDHRAMFALVGRALHSLMESTEWKSDELLATVDQLSSSRLPLVHFFERMARDDRPSGLRCIPWLSVEPGETVIGVRLGDRDVRVMARSEPIYLEDSLPFSKTSIRGREFVLLDKAGRELVSVAIETPSLQNQ